MNESFTFEGIERVEQAIRGLDEDVAYCILRDYNRKGNAGHVGRLDLEPDAVLKFVPKERLVPAEPDDLTDEFVPTQEDDGSTDDDDGSDDAGPEDGPHQMPSIHPATLSAAMPQSAAARLKLEDMLEGVCAWVRERAIGHVQTLPAAHFRFRAYSPKGMTVIVSCSFFVRNGGFNQYLANQAVQSAREEEEMVQEVAPKIEPPSASMALTVQPGQAIQTLPAAPAQPAPAAWPTAPGMVMYPANFQDGSLYGTVGAFRALNTGYEQYSRTLLTGIEQLHGMMRTALHEVGGELKDSRQQVGQLVNTVLDFRIKEIESQAKVETEDRREEQRVALAREALGQLGEAARLFFASRGAPPELSHVMGTISAHPGMMAALQNPEVVALMSSPESLDSLAETLRQVAQAGGDSAPSAPAPALQTGPAPTPPMLLPPPSAPMLASPGGPAMVPAYPYYMPPPVHPSMQPAPAYPPVPPQAHGTVAFHAPPQGQTGMTSPPPVSSPLPSHGSAYPGAWVGHSPPPQAFPHGPPGPSPSPGGQGESPVSPRAAPPPQRSRLPTSSSPEPSGAGPWSPAGEPTQRRF